MIRKVRCSCLLYLGTAVSTAISTVKVTSTQKITEVKTTIWSLTATQTQTNYETKVATSTLDVCASAAPLPSGVGSRYVDDKTVRSANNFKDCCRACFKADGCVFYEFDDRQRECKIFISTKTGECKTNSCPRGKMDISLSKNPRDLFGYGPCVGGSW